MKRLLAPIPIAVICTVVALLALLAYGISSNEPDRSVEGALAQGEREQAPALALPRLSGGKAKVDLGELPRQGRGAQLLGLVVPALPRGVAAARALAQAHLQAGRRWCSA